MGKSLQDFRMILFTNFGCIYCTLVINNFHILYSKIFDNGVQIIHEVLISEEIGQKAGEINISIRHEEN